MTTQEALQVKLTAAGTAGKHYWPFNEKDGNTVYDAWGSANGTINNADRIYEDTQDGAIHLRGTDDSYIDFGTAIGQFGTANFSIQLYIKTSETLRYFDICGNRTAGSHGNFFSLRMTGSGDSIPSGTIVAEVDQDGNGTNYIAVNSNKTGFNDGNWHEITVIREGNQLALYVDGQNVGQGTAAGVANINNGNPFRIGRSLSGVTAPFTPNATYDEFRLYND